jgi:hypothetical protein
MAEESYHVRLVTLGGASVGKSAMLKVKLTLIASIQLKIFFLNFKSCSPSE